MRDRPLRDIFSAFERAEPAYRAETFDEYRELAMLARAWEGGSLEPGVADGVPGGVDDAEEKVVAPSTVVGPMPAIAER